MAIEVATSDLRAQGKKLKSFMILIKQKLNRQQLSRSRNFRKLLAIVFDPDEKEHDVKYLLGGVGVCLTSCKATRRNKWNISC